MGLQTRKRSKTKTSTEISATGEMKINYSPAQDQETQVPHENGIGDYIKKALKLPSFSGTSYIEGMSQNSNKENEVGNSSKKQKLSVVVAEYFKLKRPFACEACPFTSKKMADFILHVKNFHFNASGGENIPVHINDHDIQVIEGSSPSINHNNTQPNQELDFDSVCGSDKRESSKTTIRSGKLDSIVTSLRKNTSDFRKSNSCNDKEGIGPEKASNRLQQSNTKFCDNPPKLSVGSLLGGSDSKHFSDVIVGSTQNIHRSALGVEFNRIPTHDVRNARTRGNQHSINDGNSIAMGGIHFPRSSHSNEQFKDLRLLLASGSVTMPDTDVLQSIECDQMSWNIIQETLHEAFSIFPYLTEHECQDLAGTTGLTVKQIKVLFVVARLQHGISWEQEEIEIARKHLFRKDALSN